MHAGYSQHAHEQMHAGYSSVSVLVTQDSLLPLHLGFWRSEDAYKADPLLSAVEPLTAEVCCFWQADAYFMPHCHRSWGRLGW